MKIIHPEFQELNTLPIFINLNHNGGNDLSKISRISLVPNSVKILGLNIDNHLSMTEHVNKIFPSLSDRYI